MVRCASGTDVPLPVSSAPTLRPTCLSLFVQRLSLSSPSPFPLVRSPLSDDCPAAGLSREGTRPRAPGGDPVRHRPRPLYRQRRAALHRARARLLAGQPLVGGQRLHPDLRRLPAPRRASCRPPRTPPDV